MAKGAERWRPVAAAVLVIAMWRSVSAPTRALVTLGRQQTVHTMNSKVGLHTRLTDEVEEWKIKRSLEMVREMGAGWIVEYFPWAYYEPEKGRFEWSHADMVVDHARTQGLKVIARLGFVPEWARPEGSPASYLSSDRFPDFGDYVYAFVEHFRGRVQHVIVWNEPNLATEWGNRAPNAREYVELLRVSYARAREAAPDVVVLAGALAPTLAPPGDVWAISDLAFLREMYDAGAASCFDALAIHAYGWALPPDDPPDESRVNYRRAELVRQVMEEHGDADKPCFVTEAGWNDHPRWTKAVSPSRRADYTVQAYRLALDKWPWCEAVCMWALRFPRPLRSYQDYFAFVASDFRPRPVYLAVEQYAGRGP